MRGRGISLLLLMFVWLQNGLGQTTEESVREQILKHFVKLDAPRTTERNESFYKIKAMGTNAVPTLIEVLGGQEKLIDELYGKTYLKAPPAIRQETLEKVQYEASSLLLNIRDTDPEKLLPLLKDTRGKVRGMAASLISSKSYNANKEVLAACLPYLKDSDATVRQHMVTTFSYNRVANWTIVVPEAKAALETALKDPAEGVRMYAALALCRVDREHGVALDTLKALFVSTNAKTRYFAAFYYLVSDDKQFRAEAELLPIFVNTLTGEDTHLQRLASETLGKYYGTQAKVAVPELQKLVQAPDFEVRKTAWSALQKIAPEIVIPMPQEDPPQPAKPAVIAPPAAPAAREQVLQLLADLYTPKQGMVFQSIKAMGTNATPLLIEILGYQPTQAEQWYEKAYAKAPAAIKGAMSKPEALEKLRSQASLLLLNMPETALYVTNLFPLLQDSRVAVRRSAASLISAYAHYQKDKMLLLEVLPALKDSDPLVRRDMVSAFRGEQAVLPRVRSALEPLLNDPVEDIKLTAADVLLRADIEHIGALQMLKAEMTSTNERTRLRATAYYVSSDPKLTRTDDDLLPLLLTALSSKDKVSRQQAASVLTLYGKRAKAAVPELQKMLVSKEYDERAIATNALQRIAAESLPKKP